MIFPNEALDVLIVICSSYISAVKAIGLLLMRPSWHSHHTCEESA